MFEVIIMTRDTRAPKIISDSKISIKIDAFWLLDRCHISKTCRDSECWSLTKKEKSRFSHFNPRICVWDAKMLISFFIKLQLSISLWILEIWQQSNDQKAYILIEMSVSEFCFWYARAVRHDKWFKNVIFDIFFEYWRLRTDSTCTQMCALKSDARHRIENQNFTLYVFITSSYHLKSRR